ncbi:APG9-domain-containing protein [Sodiomyces alkalinus F11]|uniref:Autophagy-related protein 9 n=1 Tax=Sodiomyces alkalinus (strain CBS 110278 / VKM F-3762 / F11) TaxID=1314773 RepID=A0A3N2Q7D4_SODAK|nr:APG9-domain-containing protein [Sodiomyces alkalinus F11]ROT42693.1 APG9-domain-containing protein [Sodiomyces alkalinus F11]
MTSNGHSRFLSSPTETRPFYEELRGQRDNDTPTGGEYGARVDEENWNEEFHDQDLDHLKHLDSDNSHTAFAVTANVTRATRGVSQQEDDRGAYGVNRAPNWMNPDKDNDGDNDVPASLLVERHGNEQQPNAPIGQKQFRPGKYYDTLPGRLSHKSRARWEPTQEAQQGLHHDVPLHSVKSNASYNIGRGVTSHAREKALWRWTNVSNLDFFMKDVYEYFLGSGFRCIICERVLHLVQSTFLAVFLTFLTQCIDYGLVPRSKALSDVVIPQCTKAMSWYWNLGLWLFVFYFIWKMVQFTVDTRRLLNIRDFYTYLLEIPEQDMQTVSWQDVVARIMALRDANPSTALNMTPVQRQWLRTHSKERLDAVDIASRLMRKDNYFIAMINKDILDMTLPIPFMPKRQFFSGTLQWWIYFSIIDFVFDRSGQVNQEFLKSSRRSLLSRKLRERFIAAGILNLLCTPFWIGYQTFIHFLNYYNEYRKNSATLSDRRYTALARWKFREFNELPHLFQERVNMSYPFASRYIDQFPKRLTEQFARSVMLMSGAIVFVLTVASFLDNELFLGFEITKDRTALFYIGVFGTVWALARGMIPEETTVFDPEYALKAVLDFTHYMPDHWHDKLHSFDVKQEFSQLYKLKVVILLEEITGIFLASMVLLFSAPKSSDQIIDFFREFTIHVDGLGYVCSFAEFDFKQGSGAGKQRLDKGDVREDYYSAKHGKMAASYYGFLENYMVNPKTSLPGGHVPPAVRQQFHPPPAFSEVNPPTLSAGIQGSGMERRPRARGVTGDRGQLARVPRSGPSMTLSPMASVLLDPHHQPHAAGIDGHTMYSARSRAAFPGGSSGRGIVEEATESRNDVQVQTQHHGDEAGGVFECEATLGESVWQTSPSKTVSRENSGIESLGQDTGVLGLIHQLQQAQRDNRLGGVT